MKFLDLFAGIGGFRLGLEANGHECVGFCEKDKFARTSYKAIHDTEGEIEWHDITKVSDEEFRQLRGEVDIITGGWPCQAFSVSGHRRGFEDTRGTLFFEFGRAAQQIQPSILFLENVKGLLHHDKGRTFGIILNTLDELGYDVEWQLLNSKDFGVAQHRERVYIIGYSRKYGRRKIFPYTGTNGASNISIIAHRDGFRRNTQVFDPNGITETLDTGQGGGRGHYTITKQGLPDSLVELKIREATKKGYAVAKMGDSINYMVPTSETRRGRVGKQIAQTLDTGCKQGVIVNGEPVRIRKLTPLECWRLQGFPDWAFHRAAPHNSDTQLYKQAGNSVTVPLIRELSKHF